MTYRVGLLHAGSDNARPVSDDSEIAAWEAAERSDHELGSVWAVWGDDFDLIAIAYQGKLFYHVNER